MTLVLNRSAASKKRELDQAKAAATRFVNAAIGAKREEFITALPGQEMVYLEKEGEAKAYLGADPEPANLDAFPFMKAEAEATGYSAQELAQIILFQSDLWRQIGPLIEAARVGANVAIKAADTRGEIDLILVNFNASIEVYSSI
nr:hypothetical protein [Amylibacter sp.]